MSRRALLADIGGTNACFALHGADAADVSVELATREFPTLAAALEHALDTLDAGSVAEAAVCAAGPPHGGVIALTNCDWTVSEREIRDACGVSRALLVNDFTALAAALPALTAHDLDPVGHGTPVAGAARAVLGPGTGLGVSALVPAAHGEALVTGEGGHVDLASSNPAEDRIIARLRERFDHVSAEHVLSGAGLLNLHAAMSDRDPPPAYLEPEALAAAAAARDPEALACVRQFCSFLGAAAGDLALTLGARGGVYLAGGIVRAWGPLFDREAFRRRFEDKGRRRDYLRAVPTYIITARRPALRGLARLLERAAA